MTSFSKSSSLLARLLVIFLFVAIGYSSADDVCNIGSIPPNTNCSIKLSFKGTKDTRIVQVKDLRFHSKDSLSVVIANKNESVNLFMNGFIILPSGSNEFVFYVSTTSDAGIRKIETFNAINDPKLSVNGLSKFTFLFQNSQYSDKNPIYIDSDVGDVSTLLSTDSQGVKAIPDGSNEINLDKQDLITNIKKIQLKFSTTNVYHFNLMKIDSSCSKNLTVVDKEITLNTIDKNAVSTDSVYHCVYQLTTNNQGSLQIDNVTFKTVNPYDEIVVKDGLKLTSNDLINTKTKYVSSYLNSLDKTVSSSDSLMIILSSTFVSSDYEQSALTIKKTTVKRNNQLGNFKIQGDGDFISIFTLNDSYPLLKFKDKKLSLSAKLEVYDSLENSKDPIMKFAENETINNELWSGTKVIVLKFFGAKNLNIEGTLANYQNDCNKLTNTPSTFVINGNERLANQICNFYFKPQNNGHSVVLNIESLILVDESSCLILKSVNGDKEEFKICPEKGSKDLERNHIPEIVLSSKDSYVLSYQFSAQFKDKILLQASFAYNALQGLRIHNLTELESCSISSLNYPNNYPFMLDLNELDTITTDKYIYGSVEKFDLRSNDELKIMPKLNQTMNVKDDFVLGPNTTFLVGPLTTNKFDQNSLTSYSFSQGYKINLEQVAYKLELDSNYEIKSPNYPNKFENASKSIAIIDLSQKKASYLNLTIENAKENIDYGRLTIYDGATKQTNLSNVFDAAVLKSNQTITLNTTSTKLVLIFDPLGKQTVNGFKLTIKVKDCPVYGNTTKPGLCDDDTRCILESIRCNYRTECLDKKDEKGCVNNNGPIPPHVDPEPEIIYRGLSGWWITLFIIPLSMFAGALVFKHGPRMMTRFRGTQYQEFNTFSENA